MRRHDQYGFCAVDHNTKKIQRNKKVLAKKQAVYHIKTNKTKNVLQAVCVCVCLTVGV